MMACDEGFQEVAQKLIQITADVNLRDEVIIKFAFLCVYSFDEINILFLSRMSVQLSSGRQ